jgi:hypothetical protein
MATKKSVKGLLGKNGQAWTERQKKLVENIPTSKSHVEAAKKAGDPAKNAAQSAYQALRQMRGRVPDLMDELGISERELIDKHLRRQLNAKKTIFAQKDGEFTDQRNVEALEIQSKALDMAFLLHGSHAPRDPKEAAQYGVRIIKVDIVRPPGTFNQCVGVIPESALSRYRPANSAKPAVPENGKPLGIRTDSTEVLRLLALVVSGQIHRGETRSPGGSRELLCNSCAMNFTLSVLGKIGKGFVFSRKDLGWETGIEPATFGATDRRSTS